jgi:hypothetical protein
MPSGSYTLEFKAYLNNVLVSDSSDSYFKIISSATQSGTITESIKCVFKNNSKNVVQYCNANNSDGKQYSLSGTDTAGGEISGYRGEEITWKSSCGGHHYELIDGNNEYAYFDCGSAHPSLTILSPNGGETLQKGTTHTIKWQDNSSHSALTPTTYNITLADYNAPCVDKICSGRAGHLIAKGVTGTSYFWNVGNAMDPYPDGSYILYVCRTDTTICDSSDSYFKIFSVITK